MYNFQHKKATAFAPSNIALIKYWGKRDIALNLPVTDSLSVDLKDKGAKTSVQYAQKRDEITLNGNAVPDIFIKKVTHIINFFRENSKYYQIDFETNIPVAAGLASSAALFASLVKALDRFHDTQLDLTKLSALARQGSGSAARSLWSGFVKWQRGEQNDGTDSHGISLPEQFPDLCIGILTVSKQCKTIGSTQAMLKTQESSPSYTDWPERVEQDMARIMQAIKEQDFPTFGSIAQKNAEIMHELMHEADIDYDLPESKLIKEQVRQLQGLGHQLYFTQDAGPNIKLLFKKSDKTLVLEHFPDVDVICPFGEDEVVLVDNHDHVIGTNLKLSAHQNGELHRAFSVFIFRKINNKTEVLLQQREHGKYHCGGLWTNTCCSHPQPGEDIIAAGKRRLNEEMGIRAELHPAGHFIYRAEFDNGLVEHELDHVLVGFTDQQPQPNIAEVADTAWVSISDLKNQLAETPERFTPWVKEALMIALHSR